MSRVLLQCMVLVLALSFSVAHADELLYRYECDVVPYDPSAGWQIFDACDQACSESLEPGHLVLSWPPLVLTGRFVNYTLVIARSPYAPPPPPFWVEWRFASNISWANSLGDDASFVVNYMSAFDLIDMGGDAIVSFDGGTGVAGLELGAFRTFRFETADGFNYCFWYDGKLFVCGSGGPNLGSHYLQIYGNGGFDPRSPPPGPIENRWDYVRYGRITTGEAIIASDPPGGVVDASAHPNLDRFTVTFDQPNYVKIDEVTVEAITNYELPITNYQVPSTASGPSTPATGQFDLRNSQFAPGAPGSSLPFDIPVVVATRRQDNGPPETVEIVLDRPLAVGTKTRFTFNTGGTPNTVEYTLVLSGACCLTDGGCIVTEESDCAAAGGAFTARASCTASSGCCLSGGSCANRDPICCAVQGGSAQAPGTTCEGDADHDGVDGLCGDACPTDPAKTAPGLCGCGVSDVDTDGDTVPDCLDQCPGKDDRIDANANGVADCLEAGIIPTASAWGIIVLAFLLLIIAKIRFARRGQSGLAC